MYIAILRNKIKILNFIKNLCKIKFEFTVEENQNYDNYNFNDKRINLFKNKTSEII